MDQTPIQQLLNQQLSDFKDRSLLLDIKHQATKIIIYRDYGKDAPADTYLLLKSLIAMFDESQAKKLGVDRCSINQNPKT